ncbi:MAG: class I SAM-dependent RNA methyltransferase, partial [Anaerolineales bacterium]|nr:class I SAM-dependent RNA methyltransferase [Anaerolineales bacterium]
MDTYFAVTAPGLEPFTAAELRTLFPDLEPAAPEPGGVTFRGDLAALYRANLHLRTANRVLARLGNFFYATTFEELQKRASRLPWERFLTPGQPVSLRVTCHKSKLYHSDAVARHVLAALAERMGQPSINVKADDETDQPPQLVVIRLSDDKCTVSIDSSGTILHKRGYRQAVAKAPLRETMAAAILMASGWDKVS